MKRFWILVSILWLATCGGGGGSPTEPKEPAPVANFTATPTTLIQGQAVTFTSTSTGTITSYAWNVDDDPAIEGTTATYEHTYTEVGTYSVTLTVTGPGGSNPKTVADMITVSTAAPTPTTETSQTVQEDGSTTISLTATDPNGQAVTFAITTDPTNGTATLSGTEITYTPNANFYGTDSFAYTASNGTYTSDPVTITITVEGEDDEPTTNDVSATTDEDTAVTLTLDATEIDGDNYSFSIVSQPTNGTLGSVNGNQVEYTPNQDFNGTDTFTFEATDDRTFRRNVATATIIVNPVNDAPVANDVTASMNENKEFTRLMPVTITLDATDVEGDDLTYSIVGTPSNGTLGSITNNQVVYTPSQDWNGEDTFTYKANDGTADSNTATVMVTVNSVNDAPVTEDQSASTDEDTAVNITLTATDVENDNLTFTIVSDVSNGTTSLSGATVTYTPDSNWNGTDTFTFKANDGTDDSNTSTVTITVASVNDAPVANDVTASTQSRTGNMRQAVNITLDATDVEGDDLTYSLVSDVSNGTTSLSGNIVTYTPTANYDGTDTFTYKANDGTVDSNTATGTISIENINQPPVFENITYEVPENFPIIFDIPATDFDSTFLTYAIESNGSFGNATISDSEITYTPNSDYVGTDQIKVSVSDDTSTVEGIITFNVINAFFEKIPLSNLGIYQNFQFRNSIDVLNDGSYIVQYTTGFVIYDNSGNLIASEKFQNPNWRSYNVEATSDGGFILAGGLEHMYSLRLGKYSSSGSEEWIKDFNTEHSEHLYAVTETSDGGFVASGVIMNVELCCGLGSSVLIKTDSSGNLEWDKIFSYTSYAERYVDSNGLVEADNGDIIFSSYGENSRITRVNSNATSEIWTLNTGPITGTHKYINKTSDGGLLIPSGNNLYKFDGSANYLWKTKNIYAEDAFELSNGEIIVTSAANYSDLKRAIVYKYDASGQEILWEKDFSKYIAGDTFPFERDQFNGVEDKDGNIVLIMRDILIKLNLSNGELFSLD